MVFSENIRKHGLRQYIEVDFIICLNQFYSFSFVFTIFFFSSVGNILKLNNDFDTSTQPVRVGWNFNKILQSLRYTTLKYYFDFWNKLVLLCLFDMRCLRRQRIFFCSILPIIFVGQPRFLSFFFSIFLYSDSQEYPKHRLLPLYEEEFKT